jgi:hypothetical protein
MSKRQAYYEDCRMLYMRNNDLGTVATISGVSVTTLSKWKQEGDWETQRKQFNRHPLAMAEKINSLMENIVNAIVASGGQINAEQADQLSKLSSVKKTLSSAEDLPSMVIKVTDEFSQFIRRTEKDEKFAGKISLKLAEFYQQIKEANYGS